MREIAVGVYVDALEGGLLPCTHGSSVTHYVAQKNFMVLYVLSCMDANMHFTLHICFAQAIGMPF